MWLERLICWLWRGHYWITTRELRGVLLECMCFHCAKVQRAEVIAHDGEAMIVSILDWHA